MIVRVVEARMRVKPELLPLHLGLHRRRIWQWQSVQLSHYDWPYVPGVPLLERSIEISPAAR